jgi:choline dehydrogenase-like flavoprotein
MAQIYDAIIVGSGASGGWAAKELTEGGMRVLLLDAGETPEEKERSIFWQNIGRKLKYRGKVDQRTLSLQRQPIQSLCAAWDWNFQYFVDDLDNPYTTPEDKPFSWYRSRQVGGRMAVKSHGRQFFRFSDRDFKAASRDGYGENWPIAYADIVPYYERIERWVKLRGTVEHIPHLPDSVFLGPQELNDGEQLFKASIENRWKDRRVIPARIALQVLAVPAALKTGKLTLRSNAVAHHIITDTKTGNAKGVAFVDRRTKKSHEVFGKIVVVAASAIESARLLLNSTTPQHPQGLGNNSSGVLGHYLMDHVKAIDIFGIVPNGKRFAPNQGPGYFYMPEFRNVHDRHPDFIRSYDVQGNVARGMAPDSEFAPFGMWGYCEMLSRFENCVTINQDKKDAWGIPVAHISCTLSDNERALVRDQLEAAKEMAAEAGFIVQEEAPKISPPGSGNHECGTARMGNDPKTSFLNPFNQSWDVKNLFVTDASAFVSQGCKKPTLTIMALTARTCDYILDQYKKDDLK